MDLSFVISALGRAGYGAGTENAAVIARSGFPAWVEEQLAPRDEADADCAARLSRLTLRVKYGAGKTWPAVDENRKLTLLDRPIEEVWPLLQRRAEMDGAERRRPRDEVIAATILRAVYSKWQLREVLCGFWHDHFHVDAFSSDQVAIALPVYDRDVIRRHCLGNFRALLEAVATSTAMQYYLSQHSSRAGAANENYARELFELHTMGRSAYLNDHYDRWRDVPGALTGTPSGFIDEDVYEAARALTGWTVEDGAGIDGGRKLPATGRFAYVESWHDGYQKRVLATEFKEFAPAMADGRRVLDLLAHHPATAQFIAAKLCRRFLGDSPPAALIATTAETWNRTAGAPDQIAQAVKHILLAPEFMQMRGVKLRRPLALAAAFARAFAIDLVPTEGLANEIANAGQRLFGWPAPTGLPDSNAWFLGANSMRRRWSLVLGIAENWWGTGVFEPSRRFPDLPPTPRRAVAELLRRLQGRSEPASVAAILAGLGWNPDIPVGEPGRPETEKRLARIAALCAMTPEFQTA
jgi:uncharacterized protein (DUF1800 family)